MGQSPKILSLSTLARLRPSLTKVVLVGGTFDILHAGHIRHLQRAKRYGETLIVHVVGNKRVREKKGPGKPVFDEKERAYLMAALIGVDYVFIYNGRHYDPKVLGAIRPDILYFNAEAYTDAIRTEIQKNERELRVVIDKEKKVNSSSKIIKKILQTPH